MPEDPTKEGHTFDGWYLEENWVTAWDETDTVSSNLTLYATWVRNTYVITFDLHGGTPARSPPIASAA
jgi:uncharacterized repeat protein (TIGR02543 family)